MRERRIEDWRTDLGGRHGLEETVAAALAAHQALRLVGRSTHAYDRLDYQLAGPGGRRFEVELKAKHQRYAGWGGLRPEVAEGDLFILDELGPSSPGRCRPVRVPPRQGRPLRPVGALVPGRASGVHQGAGVQAVGLSRSGEGQGAARPVRSWSVDHIARRCPRPARRRPLSDRPPMGDIAPWPTQKAVGS